MWNEHADCQARAEGGWDIDDMFRGSFIVYVCDRPMGHLDGHCDSFYGVSWGAVVPMKVGAAQ